MVACPPMTPSISAFFPCYNDAGTIATMVVVTDKTLRQLTDDYEIIVVNDGSPDHSAEILAELQEKYPNLHVVTHEKNRGYGAALRSGFANATKDLGRIAETRGCPALPKGHSRSCQDSRMM